MEEEEEEEEKAAVKEALAKHRDAERKLEAYDKGFFKPNIDFYRMLCSDPRPQPLKTPPIPALMAEQCTTNAFQEDFSALYQKWKEAGGAVLVTLKDGPQTDPPHLVSDQPLDAMFPKLRSYANGVCTVHTYAGKVTPLDKKRLLDSSWKRIDSTPEDMQRDAINAISKMQYACLAAAEHKRAKLPAYAINIDAKTAQERSKIGLAPESPLAKLSGNRLVGTMQEFPGVHFPYGYISFDEGTVFAAHIEDANLGSINYLHCGYPKLWCIIPAAEKHHFEDFVRSHLGARCIDRCSQFVRHASIWPSLPALVEAGVKFSVILQEPGQVVVTFPDSYHFGANTGPNIAEAVNYAPEEWSPADYRYCDNDCGAGPGPHITRAGLEPKRTPLDLPSRHLESETGPNSTSLASNIPERQPAPDIPERQPASDLPAAVEAQVEGMSDPQASRPTSYAQTASIVQAKTSGKLKRVGTVKTTTLGQFAAGKNHVRRSSRIQEDIVNQSGVVGPLSRKRKQDVELAGSNEPPTKRKKDVSDQPGVGKRKKTNDEQAGADELQPQGKKVKTSSPNKTSSGDIVQAVEAFLRGAFFQGWQLRIKVKRKENPKHHPKLRPIGSDSYVNELIRVWQALIDVEADKMELKIYECILLVRFTRAHPLGTLEDQNDSSKGGDHTHKQLKTNMTAYLKKTFYPMTEKQFEEQLKKSLINWYIGNFLSIMMNILSIGVLAFFDPGMMRNRGRKASELVVIEVWERFTKDERDEIRRNVTAQDERVKEIRKEADHVALRVVQVRREAAQDALEQAPRASSSDDSIYTFK